MKIYQQNIQYNLTLTRFTYALCFAGLLLEKNYNRTTFANRFESFIFIDHYITIKFKQL